MTTIGQIERRAFAAVELRAEPDSRVVTGHAAVFNKLSENLGGFVEQVAPRAFAQTIAEDDIRALWNHDPNYVLGRNRSGTLRLREDDTGLAISIDAPETQWASDLLTTIRRGDVSQMSFGFLTEEDSWEQKDGLTIRTLRRARLMDVSAVTFPAYQQTDVAVAQRSLEAWRAQQEPPAEDPDWTARRQRLDLLAPSSRKRA